MPLYVYESLTRPGVRYEWLQSLHDAALTHHPESGEPLRRVVGAGVAVHTRGLRRSTVVNKALPAATACGCASNTALANAVVNRRGQPATPAYTLERAAADTRARSAHGGHCHHGHGHNHG